MATTTTTRTYTIDKAHSETTFHVRYLLTKVRGRFSDFDGTIQFDQANPENSSIDFTIQATSIDTNEPDRDKHLRSEDFFAVGQFNSITFKSKRIIKRGAEMYDVVGDLTMHGVTKEITLPVTHLGAGKDPWGRDKIGFETEIALNRKDFGLTWNTALEAGGFLIGDEVKVSVTVQGVGQ
jgi:polyisoprenoid-binding protein YceI